jgi:hypothetical protein
MTVSLLHPRRWLLGLVVAGSLGFGATQAIAAPGSAAVLACPDKGYDYPYSPCANACGGRGYCAEGGICRCGSIP